MSPVFTAQPRQTHLRIRLVVLVGGTTSTWTARDHEHTESELAVAQLRLLYGPKKENCTGRGMAIAQKKAPKWILIRKRSSSFERAFLDGVHVIWRWLNGNLQVSEFGATGSSIPGLPTTRELIA